MDRAPCSRALGLLLGAALCACSQRDDVVAQLSLAVAGTGAAEAGSGGAAGAAGAAQPEPPAEVTPGCESDVVGWLQLKRISDRNCEVSLSEDVRGVLNNFFATLPATMPGESVPFSQCTAQLPFLPQFYQGENPDEYFLCPAQCALLRDRVAREQAKIDACVDMSLRE